MAMLLLRFNTLGCDTVEQLAINAANLDGATPFHRGRGGMVSRTQLHGITHP